MLLGIYMFDIQHHEIGHGEQLLKLLIILFVVRLVGDAGRIYAGVDIVFFA